MTLDGGIGNLRPDRIDEISTKLDAARDAALALSLGTNVQEMSQIAEIQN